MLASKFLEGEIKRHESLGNISVVVNLQLLSGILQRSTSPAVGFKEIGKALTRATEADLFYEQALSYLELGFTAQSEGQKEKALQHFLKGVLIAENHHLADLAFRIYYSIGHLQYASDNFDEAIAMLAKGLRFYTFDEWMAKKEFRHNLMSSYNTMGLAYMRAGLYPQALDSFRQSLTVANELKDEFWVGLVHGNMGNVYLKRNIYDSALLLLTIDLKASKKFNSKNSIASTYISLAELHEDQRDLATAEAFYDSAEFIINELNIPYPSYYIKRAELEYRMKDYKAASEYGFIYKVQNDSLAKQKRSKELSLALAGFDFENKLTEMTLLEKENLLKDEELKYKNLLIYGSAYILLMSVILILVLLRSNRLKVKLNETLEKEVGRRTRKLAYTVKELDTVVYRLSHDFRRPLTTLIGLDSLGRSISNDPEIEEIFDKIGKTARQMDKMLYKMTFVHEINSQKPEFTQVNPQEVLQEVVASFETELNSCQFQFEQEIDTDLTITTDPGFLRIIISNLLENAIIFSAESQCRWIKLKTGVGKDEWFLEVADNGMGIPEQILPRLYEPFFRGSPASEGNGLGLYLVKRATRRLKGRVNVRSVPNEGTTFTVTLPRCY